MGVGEGGRSKRGLRVKICDRMLLLCVTLWIILDTSKGGGRGEGGGEEAEGVTGLTGSYAATNPR